MPELIADSSIRCAGYTFQLLPQRALWWASEKTLLVADVHLGKGATFRALGQPLPRGAAPTICNVLLRWWRSCKQDG